MQMTLADGRTQTTEILKTSVDISIQGKVIPTELLTLKNRTLLGIDFLTAAGIVLDLQRKQWYFTETSHRKYNFVKAPPNINALLTVDPKPHLCQLRKNEEGNIKKKQEIDRLLSEGIIEECESPYASPVVLIPKPNGTFRLCIDYRKLNEITVADTYPLPRMDDLLHQAKLTPFMSTLDLRAGYHQVKVHVEDQDKTAFVCPFWHLPFLTNAICYLTKKKVKWQWGFDQQNAFQTLKNSLTTPPVLKQADGTKPYIIRTDASNYALGAVLLQGEGSDEHPIEYASRLLTPAERNYSTTERGGPCCDMLSRPVTHEESFCEENNITIADMPTRSCKDMRETQLKDDNLKKIIDSFESPLKTEEYANWTERGFLMNQGVMYRYVPDADSAEAQLVIPTAERELIMERHHNDPMAGHYGEEGTFQKIARRYYWTGMRKYISDYIKQCPECARFKATNQKPAGLLRTQSIHRDLKSLLLIYLGHCLKLTQVNNGYSLSRIVPRSGLSYLPFLKPVLVNVQQL
ncbi:hypothetical protein TNCV_1009661 [Trichonephila clavipes]|nr:hypothetical protein TNCV_1009661 [Trichonephila clavipes]